MEKISISVNVINAVLQYLDTRPHNEVRRLIDAIQQDAQQAVQPVAQPDAQPAEPDTAAE